MRFLIDEQLPQLLADWLQIKGYDAVHVTTLLTNRRIPDDYICERSIAEQRVVITKDEDFFKTYLIKQQPYKLVHLTTGNLKNRQLMDLFRANFDSLLQILETASVVEFNQVALKIWY
jgi:predicted nuclease of predicted toxin-antitoxin system